MKAKVMPGINIQWPWSELLLSGQKTIETRVYPLPEKFIGIELAVIETPGKRGKREAGFDKARIVGTITFSGSFQYESREEWAHDISKHCVKKDDPQFGWKADRAKYGWIVKKVRKLSQPVPPPISRGIRFASECHL